IADRHAAHQIGDQPRLLRRDAGAAQHGFGLCRVVHGITRHFAAEAGAAAGAPAAGRGAPAAAGAAAFLSPAVWPLKMRVAANSPSLCPTMFSLTSTGTC